MRGWLKRSVFAVLVRPILLLLLGFNVRHRERLPAVGPAIVAANHNSHLDALVLMALLEPRALPLVRPVAAADYFLANRLLAAFALHVLEIIPIRRGAAGPNGGSGGSGERPGDVLEACEAALRRGEILILFPEGTRGEPEEIGTFKSGVGHLMERYPEARLVPVFTHGLGKSLPRGSWLPVPFFCDVLVGADVPAGADRRSTTQALRAAMERLRSEGSFPEWQ